MKKKRRLLQSDTFWGTAAVLLVLLQFWWLPGEDGSAADSYSTTVDGKLGLFRTLSELFPTVRREATRVVPEDLSTLLIIAPDEYPTRREEEQLRQFVYDGGTLLFAPSLEKPEVSLPSLSIRLTPNFHVDLPFVPPSAIPVSPPGMNAVPPEKKDDSNQNAADSNQPTADSAQQDPASVANSPDSSSGPAGPTTTPVPKPEEKLLPVTGSLASVPFEITSRSEIIPPYYEHEVLLGSENAPVAISWLYGSGRIVVCASPDLFSNRSMLYKPSRRAAVRLVEHAANLPEQMAAFSRHVPSTIVISEYFNTTDSFRDTGVLFSPMMRIGTLQLLLVAVLGIWLAFYRFGPASETVHVNRRSLRESAEAVGNLQYRLSDGAVAVRSYMDFLRSQLRRRFGSSVRLEDPKSIADKARLEVDEVTVSLREATRMANTTKLSASGAASSIRWLSRLQLRLFGNSVEERQS
ncbi:MAG: DUF4350 domain-containing protein [Planctomycetaceae bacterium]